MISLLISFSGVAHADEFDDRINALKVQVAQQQSTANALRGEAQTYQARVAQLQAEAAALQSQINLNQAKYNKVSAEIEAAKAKLIAQKAILAESVKQMYLDSGITPLEMLASSSNISEFMDKQQYQDKVKTKIQETMVSIQTLKDQLETQQRQVAQLLADQRGQKAQLAVMQQEANRLLASAQQSAAAADQQVRESNSQITQQKAAQAAALAARYASVSKGFSGGGSCGGGYPAKWCNLPKDAAVDSWGMYTRECVSYTAFKVAASGRYMPYWGGRGNANQWPANARALGLDVDYGSGARPGDVAISMPGPYGHAMYVESVSGNNVYVSQYNFANNGEYSTMTIPMSGLYFIHF